jgi:hypothetical protein
MRLYKYAITVLSIASSIALQANSTCESMIAIFTCDGNKTVSYEFFQNDSSSYTLYTRMEGYDVEATVDYLCKKGVLVTDTNSSDFKEYLGILSPSEKSKFRKNPGEYRLLEKGKLQYSGYDPDKKKAVRFQCVVD